jgi:uncharacterized protein (TIGR02996 family)
MSEESAFLAHLAANPGDDVTRLVYADWLDESGDERAGFLRAEQELARLGEDDPRAAELGGELSERLRSLRWDWLAVAGKRWDVWLIHYDPVGKIPVIKAAREVTCCGLAEAKHLVESAPVCVLRSCTLGEAEMVREHLRNPEPSSSPYHPREPAGVAIRPCPAPTTETMFRPTGPCDLVIHGYRRSDSREAVVDVLRSHLPWVTESFDDEGLPCVFEPLAEPKARLIAEELQTWATVDVVPKWGASERALRVPIIASRTGPGPFEVRMLSYPPEQQTAVIVALRDLHRSQGPGATWSVKRLPIILRSGVDGAEAERVRRLFAELGQVEIGMAATG